MVIFKYYIEYNVTIFLNYRTFGLYISLILLTFAVLMFNLTYGDAMESTEDRF